MPRYLVAIVMACACFGQSVNECGYYGTDYDRADFDCDGCVTNFDIDGFVQALVGFGGPPCCQFGGLSGDINGDGVLNNFDIDAFVDLLTAPASEHCR